LRQLRPRRTAGAAIFWELNKLERNDEINVALQDGTSYTYKIVSMYVVTPRDDGNFDTSVGTVVSIQDLVGPTEKESITLITCGGTFNARTHEYDKRLIVRAERQPAPSAKVISNQ
jgi:LPXTG-site transpeptidase (sortase) family protein